MRRWAARILKFLGYLWVAAMLGAHYLGEAIGFDDPLAALAQPVRYFLAILLCIPGIGLILWGRHLSGHYKPQP